MKKAFAIFLSLTLFLLALAGCGQSVQSEGGTADSSHVTGSTPSVAEDSSVESESTESDITEWESEPMGDTVDEPSHTSDVLVVYYSAQEHTKGVAEIVAATLHADVFVITPAEVYTEDDLDWTNQTKTAEWLWSTRTQTVIRSLFQPRWTVGRTTARF